MDLASKFRRPKTAADAARLADSEEAFGYSLRDWQHELRHLSRKEDFRKAFAEPPALLAETLQDGSLADAYLGAYVQYACNRFGFEAPEWVYDERRIADTPWFSLDTRAGRHRLLILTPAEFAQRNLFTVPDLPFGPKRGRPRKSRIEINRANAERQKRYRQRLRSSREDRDLADLPPE